MTAWLGPRLAPYVCAMVVVILVCLVTLARVLAFQPAAA